MLHSPNGTSRGGRKRSRGGARDRLCAYIGLWRVFAESRVRSINVAYVIRKATNDFVEDTLTPSLHGFDCNAELHLALSTCAPRLSISLHGLDK
jgi:hypothetical protein